MTCCSPSNLLFSPTCRLVNGHRLSHRRCSSSRDATAALCACARRSSGRSRRAAHAHRSGFRPSCSLGHAERSLEPFCNRKPVPVFNTSLCIIVVTAGVGYTHIIEVASGRGSVVTAGVGYTYLREVASGRGSVGMISIVFLTNCPFM